MLMLWFWASIIGRSVVFSHDKFKSEVFCIPPIARQLLHEGEIEGDDEDLSEKTDAMCRQRLQTKRA